jgi:hypothetical protein
MLKKLRPRSAYDVIALLALCLAVGTGGAYAANTIGSDDVIDNSLLGADVKGTNGTTTTSGVNGAIRTEDVSGQKAIPASGQAYVNGSLNGFDIADGSLTGADINGSTLSGVNAASLDGLDSSDFVRSNTMRVIYPLVLQAGEGSQVIIRAASMQFSAWCAGSANGGDNNAHLNIDSDVGSNFAFASQSLGGASGDRGDLHATHADLATTGDNGATPVTGFAKDGATEVMFSLYQTRELNFQNVPFCTFGGYFVQN